MKKNLCYFLLLVFSTSVFSQDNSLLEENFSLTKYSRKSNIYFFIPHPASPVNNLFQPEENYNSDQYKIFQMHRFQQFSERPFPIEAYFFKNKKQKWGYKYSPKYGQVQDIVSEEKSESLAEGYLKRLAERKKRSRKTWGAAGLIGGGLFIGLGAAAMSSAEEASGWEGFGAALAGVMFITTGTACVVVGALSFALPSGAEREYKDIERISDLAQRERACREALSLLASRGKRRRIFSGALIAVFSAIILFGEETDSYLSAATYGALAVYELTRKTAAERAYQNYLKEIEHQRRIKKLNGIEQHK